MQGFNELSTIRFEMRALNSVSNCSANSANTSDTSPMLLSSYNFRPYKLNLQHKNTLNLFKAFWFAVIIEEPIRLFKS